MSLTILFDNNPCDPALRTGWGFSAWLEVGGQTVLVDTGDDGAILLENMAALGLDPDAVDVVVLSHDHADHTGGLAHLLEANAGACADRGECVTVYVPPRFSARETVRARGAGATVVEVDGPLEILPGVWSTGPVGSGLVEQALAVETARGLLVITGCAHPGADRMVARAQEVAGGPVHLVVGGFHLGGTGRARLDAIVAEFRRLGVQKVAPCHCTGDEAREVFGAAYGDDYYACGVGWQWPGQRPAWRSADEGIPAQNGVAAVAIVPGDPGVVYLAVYEPGGLYRSDDGGHSWQEANQGLEGVAPLAVAAHPENPEMAWVGTVLGGYRTVDGGESWQPIAGLPAVPLYALVLALDGRTLYAGGAETGVWHSDAGGAAPWQVSRADDGPETILALATTPAGGVLAGTAGQGLWLSEDGGRQWERVTGRLAQGHVQSVAAVGDGRWYALSGGRLYRSVDGGQEWKSTGPPGFEALSFAAEPGSGGRLYLGSRGDGLAISADGGESWERRRGELRHADLTRLAAGPADGGCVLIGTRYNGLYGTDDSGQSWSLLTAALGSPLVTALAQDPADPLVYYAGALDGVYRSDDGGAGWRLVSEEMGKLNVQALAVGPTGEQVYAGAHSGLYASGDGGATWQWAEDDTAGISVFNVVVDPRDASRIYAGSWGHNILASTDAGRTWAPVHGGLETLSVHALALDPEDAQRLYAGTVEAVYRSADGGKTWQASPLTDRPLTVLALLVDPREPARLFAGTTEGVYLSIDHGQAWQPAGRESLEATVTALALGPDDALLAGTEHHGLYRSTDGGASWEPCGLEAASVYAILVDRAGTVWLGTDRGVFREP